MKVIIAHLNSTNDLSQFNLFMLKDTCESFGIQESAKVNTPEKLLEKLEKTRGESILLFTNFPPNSSWLGSGKTIKTEDKGSYIHRYWEADSYAESNELFGKIAIDYTFKAVHFITGAPENIISDEYLKSLVPEIIATVTRRGKWIGEDLNYRELYYGFLQRKIKEALK